MSRLRRGPRVVHALSFGAGARLRSTRRRARQRKLEERARALKEEANARGRSRPSQATGRASRPLGAGLLSLYDGPRARRELDARRRIATARLARSSGYTSLRPPSPLTRQPALLRVSTNGGTPRRVEKLLLSPAAVKVDQQGPGLAPDGASDHLLRAEGEPLDAGKPDVQLSGAFGEGGPGERRGRDEGGRRGGRQPSAFWRRRADEANKTREGRTTSSHVSPRTAQGPSASLSEISHLLPTSSHSPTLVDAPTAPRTNALASAGATRQDD